MKLSVLIAVAMSVAAAAMAADPSAARFAQGTWLDLTHAFDAATIYWPTEKGFQFQPGKNGPNPKGYYYAANRFATAEHGGTHLDAPRHFAEGRHTADEIELGAAGGRGGGDRRPREVRRESRV